MNALTIRDRALDVIDANDMRAERLSRLTAATFTVWRLLGSGKAQAHPVAATTLLEIEREIATEAAFGATFMVRETATLSGRATLHTYRIRREKWTGRYADGRKVYPHSADKLFALEVSAFEPVEPWRWTPGADVLGVDAGLIEGRRA